MLAHITGSVNENLLRRIEYLLEPLAPFALHRRMGSERGEPSLCNRDPGGNWQNLVFARFAEAVEVTAVQRGCERWSPYMSNR
jgi:hypothetical protein